MCLPGYPVSFDTFVQDTDASELCSTFYWTILFKSAEICLQSVWIQCSCACSVFKVMFLLCPCAQIKLFVCLLLLSLSLSAAAAAS